MKYPFKSRKEFIIHQQNPYSETFLLLSLRTTKWLYQTSFTELQRELITIWLWHWCDFQELFLHYCCCQSIAALLTSYSLPQHVTRPAPLISLQPADRIGSVRVATYLPGFSFTCSKMVGVTKSAVKLSEVLQLYSFLHSPLPWRQHPRYYSPDWKALRPQRLALFHSGKSLISLCKRETWFISLLTEK